MKYKQEHQDGGLGLSIYLVVEVPSYAENNKPNQTERLESQMGCHGLSLHTFLFLDWHWVLLNLVLRLWGQQNFRGRLGLVGLSFLQYRLGGLLFQNVLEFVVRDVHIFELVGIRLTLLFDAFKFFVVDLKFFKDLWSSLSDQVQDCIQLLHNLASFVPTAC